MKKLLIIGFVWPEPNTTAAGSRMMQLIRFFKEEHFEIFFMSAALTNSNSADLKTLGVNTVQTKINNQIFNTQITDIQPDIVMFDRFLTEEQFGWRVRESCPNAMLILDTEDLHFLRKSRAEAVKKEEEHTFEMMLACDITHREIASIYRCDLSLIISRYEKKLLINKFNIPSELICYVPFLIAIDELQPSAQNSFQNRSDFITLGNYNHEPNWDALKFLKDKIWPAIKTEIPNAKLLNYGTYQSEKIGQLHNEAEGFLISGAADSVKEVYEQARVCLAPLRFGAGLKGKLLDAMIYELPSVTTEIGAEGMHHHDGWNGFIVNTADEIAKKAVSLYTNEELWNKSVNKGRELLDAIFNKDLHSHSLSQTIKTILHNLNRHRASNLIGNILHQESMQRLKYMSKWIEIKNQKR